MGSKFQPHFVLLCDKLNLDPLLPYLRQERMVTSDEYETLTNVAYTKKQQRERLLIILPRKGKNYFQNFGKCLVWSGQEELARHIGVDVESVPEAPYKPSATPPGVSQENQAILHAISDLITGAGISRQPPPPYPSSSVPPNPPSYTDPSPSSSHASHQSRGQGASVVPEKQRPSNQDEYRGGGGASYQGGGIPRAMERPMQHGSSGNSGPYLQQPVLQPAVPVGKGGGEGGGGGAPHNPPSQPASRPHLARLDRGQRVTKVFILYCKDHLLQALFNVSDEDFCADVLDLADSLTSCGGIECIADFYKKDHPQSWSVWTENHIRDCDYVLYICSPLLISDLRSGDNRNIYMHDGMFFGNAVVHSIVAPKFVPVFLNDCVPRDPKQWLPSQLHASRQYKLNIRDFADSVLRQEYSIEQRSALLASNLGRPEYREMASLVRFLRGEQDVVPPTRPDRPIPIPAPPPERPVYQPAGRAQSHNLGFAVSPELYIPEQDLHKIAERLPRDWIHLGIKLGVEYATLEGIRRKHVDNYVPAVLDMIKIWQQLKGNQATRKVLKKALIDIGFGRVAVECFPDESI